MFTCIRISEEIYSANYQVSQNIAWKITLFKQAGQVRLKASQ